MDVSNKYLKNRLPNYDKTPFVEIPEKADMAISGWEKIRGEITDKCSKLKKSNPVVVIEYYPGVNEEELFEHLISPLNATITINTNNLFIPEEQVRDLTQPDVTNDEVFGYITRLTISHFIDAEKLLKAQQELQGSIGLTVVYGYGAGLVAPTPDVLIYADMPRWELQLRYRRKEVSNLGLNNKGEKATLQYKRGFFVDWRVADNTKRL